MVRIGLIALALLLAAAAGWMVQLYLSAKQDQLIEMAERFKPKPAPTSEVLVSVGPIDIGAVLSAGDLRWASWPDDGINDHYLTRKGRPDAIDRLAGSAARQSLFPGEPITEDKLVLKQDGGFLAAVLPDNSRAITLKVDEASGMAGLLLPGDHVDIILTHEVSTRDDEGQGGGGLNKRVVGETIVTDLRVLAVDQEIKHDDKAQAKVAKTVTLAVNTSQAESIAVGRMMGTLTLALRSVFRGAGLDDLRAKGYTASTDISGALRDRALPPPPKPPVPVPEPPYTVTVFRGATPETVTLGR